MPAAKLPPDLMSAPEVAKVLGCSLSTIHRWVSRDYLHPVDPDVGTQLRFRRDEVKEFGTRCKEGETPRMISTGIDGDLAAQGLRKIEAGHLLIAEGKEKVRLGLGLDASDMLELHG